jgi:hypothetical protein
MVATFMMLRALIRAPNIATPFTQQIGLRMKRVRKVRSRGLARIMAMWPYIPQQSRDVLEDLVDQFQTRHLYLVPTPAMVGHRDFVVDVDHQPEPRILGG